MFAQEIGWQQAFNYGLPTVLLLLGCLGLWRVAQWARSEVVKPMVTAHVNTMNTFAEQMPRQTEAISGLKNSVDTLNTRIANLCQDHRSDSHDRT